MPLPASFLRDGFQPFQTARKRVKLRNGKFLKPVMIGTEGAANTGKSEFLLSCPDPSQILCVDRGIDPVFDNPNPPATRREDFGIRYLTVPLNTTSRQPEYLEYYRNARTELYKALDNPDSITVAIDGDSDLWELQVLAEFGKNTQIYPQTRWGDVYAARRALTARCHDSGKIIIGTNKVKDEYETVIGPDGLPEKDKATGEDRRVKTGRLERQGFRDHDYLWNIQIQHLYEPAKYNPVLKKTTSQKWGIKILKCKPDPTLVGSELWGDDCCFAGLVQLVYPQIDPAEFGL